jgi:hypothetical protein
MPLRLTILHLAQRFRTDGETFMMTLLTNFHSLRSQGFDYTRSSLIRLDYTKCTFSDHGSQNSQDKRFSFGDSDRVLKMRCQ